MRPHTVSFAETDDSCELEWGGSIQSSIKAPTLQASKSQPKLRNHNYSNWSESGGNNKANKELTAIDARLAKLQDRVRQTLSGGNRLSTDVIVPKFRRKRASTSHGTNFSPEGERNLSVIRKQHFVAQHQKRVPLIKVDPPFSKSFAVTEPIVNRTENTTSSKPAFTDQRLQNYADQYDREVDTFTSVALHAEIKLKQLNLLGEVPNKLALAVSLDVLRRLGEVGGRYEDIISRVHSALLPHCYLNLNSSLPSTDPTISTLEPAVSASAVKFPATLHDYLKARPTFLHVEKVERENKEMLKKLKKLREDRVSSIAMLSDFQKGELVWDALYSKAPFDEIHLKSAIHRNARDAINAIWDHIRVEKDPNNIAGHLRSILHHTKFSDQLNGASWTDDANNKYKQEVVKGMFNARLDNPANEDTGNTIASESPTNNTSDNVFELDSTMYSWLLDPKNSHICSDLVLKLKANVDHDKVIITKAETKKPAGGMHEKRRALEQFILGANEEDIGMLRTMVLTWDYQNGVEWKLSTKDSQETEEAKAKLHDEEIIRLAVENERKRKAAEEQAALAHKAIFQLKTNVASKMAGRMKEKARKAKLNKMMSKFRTVALTCVRGPLAGHIKVGPNDVGTCVDGNQIDKEIAILMKQNAVKSAKLQQASWSKALEAEILKASKRNASGEKKKKKMMFKKESLPESIGQQITSFRIAYTDLMRFMNKSATAISRLAHEVYVKHAEIHRSDRMKHRLNNNGTSGRLNQSNRIKALKQKRNQPDNAFAKTLYDHFLEKYGLPEIADANMVGLSSALVKHRYEDSRLDIFAKFCFGELNKHVATGYSIGITMLAETSTDEQNLVNENLLKHSSNSVGGGSGETEGTRSIKGPSSPKSKTLRKRKSRRASVSKNVLHKDDCVVIPTENWWCSLSSIKIAMANAMSTSREEHWKEFISEIEKIAEEVAMKKEDESPRKRLSGNSTASPSSPTSKQSTFSKIQATVFKGTVRKYGKHTQKYTIKQDDFCKIAKADDVLKIFLQYWSKDLHAKEEHLKNVFMAADVDGDGELTTSEFISLIHSVDHNVPESDIIKMYKDVLQKTENECLDPEVFVAMCYENGLVHRAWDNKNNDSLYNIAHKMDDLRKTWNHAKPFVLGTLRSLERDLPSDHPLRTLTEAGDGSLADIRMQLDNFQTFSSSAETTKMAWHSYWMILKHVNEAAAEGPGIQTLYGNDIPGTRRTTEDAPPLQGRSIKSTPHKQRRRRNGLPFIMLPDTARTCGSVASWGPAGGKRRQYIIPSNLRLRNGVGGEDDE